MPCEYRDVTPRIAAGSEASRCSAEEPGEERWPVARTVALVIALSIVGWALIIAGAGRLIG